MSVSFHNSALPLLFSFFSIISIGSDQPGKAPASYEPGPIGAIFTGEYHLPASIDPYVLPDRQTELWASAQWPNGAGPWPLVVFLHGNHATCGTGSNPRLDNDCSYTNTGTCPSGYVPVPNHAGYDYLARQMASLGFAVISVNANRGITCGSGYQGDWGLNLARGRLVLRHLSQLNQWANAGGAPGNLQDLVGKIDWSNVGLMGHSRGGEGMRAALYHFQQRKTPANLPPNLKIKGIFEIGAVDGQTDIELDANGVMWNQLLPMCDGDVSSLEGRFPYERMMKNTPEIARTQKSLYYVWGANHNFFNTEWQVSDSSSCFHHEPLFSKPVASPQQQLVALGSLPAFFMAALKSDAAAKTFNQNFNPVFTLPDKILATTRIEREFLVSPNPTDGIAFDSFDQASGTSSAGILHESAGVTAAHTSVDNFQKAASIVWNAGAGNAAYFQSNWTATGQGKDVTPFKMLEFRIARQREYYSATPLVFSIQLTDDQGKLSQAVNSQSYVDIVGPGNEDEVTFQTVRIPIAAFAGAKPTALRGVRLSFDNKEKGGIFLANIRLSKAIGVGANIPGGEMGLVRSSQRNLPRGRVKFVSQKMGPRVIPASESRVVGVRSGRTGHGLVGKPSYELIVETKSGFPVLNSLPILQIGQKRFLLSRYAEGKTNQMAFSIPTAEYAKLSSGSPLSVQYGRKNPGWIFKFSNFEKQAPATK